MNWNKIESLDTLEELKKKSNEHDVLIFKHSTRCSISSTALSRMERAWKPNEMGQILPCYLDLIKYRDISNQIATTFAVPHESPQVLLIRNGKCVFNASHLDISYDEVMGKTKH